MRILYLTNFHNPYRDEFFEQLGRKCDLTVLFEKRSDETRDASWFKGAKATSFRELFLPESERGFASPTMARVIEEGWTFVIVGCFNSPQQMVAIGRMRKQRIPYIVNSDGWIFDTGSIVKRVVRRHVLRGADAYLCAGESCVPSLRQEIGPRATIFPYPLSSLTNEDVTRLQQVHRKRDSRIVLVVGQYENYKGLDVALDALKTIHSDIKIKFIGMGRKTDSFHKLVAKYGLEDVELVPFLSPTDLYREYQTAGLMILPSRQECWGLVAIEAAACGCPIVSTWGSGAAIDLLFRDYPQQLADPGDSSSLAAVIKEYFNSSSAYKQRYSQYLSNAAGKYTIENSVSATLKCFKEVWNRR